MTYNTSLGSKDAGDGLIFVYIYGEYMMSKPCVKFRWKVFGTNINIAARLRHLPLQSRQDNDRLSVSVF